MQLRHLQYFVATADAGSVSAAAVAVHVTQPALSRQLRQLEHDLGVGLFDRSAGRLALNRTGRALLPAVREILAATDALEAAASFHARGRLERLTIGAPTVTLTDVVSPFVATLSADDPVIDVRAADGTTTTEMLAGGSDLAISTQRPRPPYRSRALAELPVWAYVVPDDPWVDRVSVPLAELVARPLVVLPATFTAREALDAAVASRGTAYSSLVEAGNGTIAQALTASGRGVAVVSDDPRFDLRPIPVDVGEGRRLRVRLVAGWDPRSVSAAAVEGMVDRLARWVLDRYPGSHVPPL